MLRRLMVTSALVVLVGEVGLRATRGTWHRFEDFDDVPRMTDPHPSLGWVNRPGTHDLRGVPTTVDLLGDRSSGGDVVLFGGSFLYGFGLTDPDVVGAQLGVRNRSVPGYGTVQSARLAQRTEVRGKTVVYGFVELHEARNVAAASWLHALERSGRDASWVAVPWARWDGTRLVDGGPTAYTHWSWSERVAWVDAVERAWVHLNDRMLRTKARTTIELMERFRHDVESRGGRFVVALLDVPSRRTFYERELHSRSFEWVDLQIDGSRLPDGHPTALHHRQWAERLREML